MIDLQLSSYLLEKSLPLPILHLRQFYYTTNYDYHYIFGECPMDHIAMDPPVACEFEDQTSLYLANQNSALFTLWSKLSITFRSTPSQASLALF